MPATVNRGITGGKPGFGATPMYEALATAQAFAKESVLIDGGAGTVERGAADLTTGIVGVSIGAGDSSTTSLVEYVPALPGVLFEITFEDFVAGSSHTSVQTDLLAQFALQRDVTNDRWLLDENDTGNPAARLVQFNPGDLGDAPTRVQMMILVDATIWGT